MHAGSVCTNYSAERSGAANDRGGPQDGGGVQDAGHRCTGMWGDRYASPHVSYQYQPPSVQQPVVGRDLFLSFCVWRGYFCCGGSRFMLQYRCCLYRIHIYMHFSLCCIFFHIQAAVAHYVSSGYCILECKWERIVYNHSYVINCRPTPRLKQTVCYRVTF